MPLILQSVVNVRAYASLGERKIVKRNRRWDASPAIALIAESMWGEARQQALTDALGEINHLSPSRSRVSTQPTLPQAVHFRCAEISYQSQSGRSASFRTITKSFGMRSFG